MWNNYKIKAILILSIIILKQTYCTSQEMTTNRQDSIVGDVNNDGLQDYIIEKYDGFLHLYIHINKGNGKYDLILKRFTEPSKKNSITIEKDGFIGVEAYYGKEIEKYIFKWYPKHNDWLCFGTETLMNFTDLEYPNLGVRDIKNTYSIDNKLNTSTYSCKEASRVLQMFNDRYTTYHNEYKTKHFNLLKKHDKFETLLYLNYIKINKKNIQKFNDIGFFLNEAGNYLEASYFLENVTAFSPNRTVAYINLGDAYWGLKQMSKAKKAYQKYISLMKASGKEAKIPKRVWERIK